MPSVLRRESAAPIVRLLLATLWLSVFVGVAHGQSYLQGMPASAQIEERFRDADPTVRSAKRILAFEALQTLMMMVDAGRRKSVDLQVPSLRKTALPSGTPAEKALFAQYERGIAAAEANPAIKDFARTYQRLSDDTSFNDTMLKGLISPAAEAEIRAAMEVVKELKAGNDAEQATRQAREVTKQRWLGFASLEGVALLLGLVGGGVLRWGVKQGRTLSRYHFEHTNSHGVVEFPDYESSVRFAKQSYWAGQKIKFGSAVLVIALLVGAIGVARLT